jgi:Tfp pilus assembly protein PilW
VGEQAVEQSSEMRHIGTKRQSVGFTLTEVLVAVVIGMLVLVGVHRIFVVGLGSETTTSLQTEVDRESQVAMDDMLDRMRGGRTVVSAYANRIAFADQEGAGYCYWVANRTLYRAANTTFTNGTSVATDVSALSLTYWDQYGQQITDLSKAPAQAVTVEATLTVAKDNYAYQAKSALRYSSQLRSAARLRNKVVL